MELKENDKVRVKGTFFWGKVIDYTDVHRDAVKVYIHGQLSHIRLDELTTLTVLESLNERGKNLAMWYFNGQNSAIKFLALFAAMVALGVLSAKL